MKPKNGIRGLEKSKSPIEKRLLLHGKYIHFLPWMKILFAFLGIL